MRRLVVTGAACVALAACGGSPSPGGPDERAAPPAPKVSVSDEERAAWAGVPASPGRVPVLVYDGVAPEDFARHMTLLRDAGFETISLASFVRFVRREPADLPERPLLVTFADGRLATWRGSDAILRDLGFNAVLFVEIGPIEKADPAVLAWAELDRAQRSGRWEVQLQAGTGDRMIRFGSAPDDVGPFYAYRGADEVLGGWRERVFSDITYGEQQLAHNLEGYVPLAIAPPYGNYGQVATNDRHIPRELLARMLLSFPIVFTQDRPGFAAPGARNPIGRFEVTEDVTDAELRAMLTPAG